jgi:hypothetical protein
LSETPAASARSLVAIRALSPWRVRVLWRSSPRRSLSVQKIDSMYWCRLQHRGDRAVGRRDLARARVRPGRARASTGTLIVLPYGLDYLAGFQVYAGDLSLCHRTAGGGGEPRPRNQSRNAPLYPVAARCLARPGIHRLEPGRGDETWRPRAARDARSRQPTAQSPSSTTGSASTSVRSTLRRKRPQRTK